MNLSRPVEAPKGLGRQVYDIITDWLLTGAIAPGERISDRRIAEELGVSRTPVREALIRLERHQIVTTEPRKGTRVRVPTAEDISEIYDVRLLLEGLAAECAAKRISDASLARLQETCDNFEAGIAQGSIESCARADYEFHRTVVLECGHKCVINVLHDFDLTLFAIGSRTPDYISRAHRYLAEHRTIMEALLQRDASAARDALQRHIAGGRDELVHAMGGVVRPVAGAPSGDGEVGR